MRFHGDLEEDLWQLVHACDEAERLLMASEGPHDPKRQPLSSCSAVRNGLGASGVPTRPVSSQGAMRACAPRTGERGHLRPFFSYNFFGYFETKGTWLYDPRAYAMRLAVPVGCAPRRASISHEGSVEATVRKILHGIR